jgi:hypothetical protein
MQAAKSNSLITTYYLEIFMAIKFAPARTLTRLSLSALFSATLAACGGGGGDAPASSITTTAGNPAPAPAPATATPTVTGQRIALTYSAATADYSGSTAGIDLPEFASSAFPGTVNAVTPGYTQTTPARNVQFTFASPGGAGTAVIVPGTYTVGVTTGLWATVFYNEGPANGWEGTSGTLVVDTVVGDIVQYRFIDVRMAAGRRFGSTTSIGGFTFNGAGKARTSCLNAAQCL